MDLEVQVAVNFVTGYLYNKLPRRRVELLGEGLVRNLMKKFEGHWYPDKPSKGCGYRCLLISHSLDPVLLTSVEESGLSVTDVQSNLPEKLSLWIDPFEVSYRIGESLLLIEEAFSSSCLSWTSSPRLKFISMI